MPCPKTAHLKQRIETAVAERLFVGSAEACISNRELKQ